MGLEKQQQMNTEQKKHTSKLKHVDYEDVYGPYIKFKYDNIQTYGSNI